MDIYNSIMNFKNFIESEASLGSMTPEMNPPMINRGSSTPASDEVKRTGLQPQVDAQDIETKAKDQDRMLAIDSGIEHLEKSLPEDDDPKVNQFRQLWNELKKKWETIKMNDESPSPEEQGLADMDDPDYVNTMQQHPNMAIIGGQGPHGPGIFGQS